MWIKQMWIEKSKNKAAYFATHIVKHLCLMCVQAYRSFFSIYFSGQCRFVPSCSQYCLDSLKTQGLGRALYLSFIRLIKCHPFCKSGGYDPVPQSPQLSGQLSGPLAPGSRQKKRKK